MANALRVGPPEVGFQEDRSVVQAILALYVTRSLSIDPLAESSSFEGLGQTGDELCQVVTALRVWSDSECVKLNS